MCVRSQAGTFEERNVTEWAKERLTQLLQEQKQGSVCIEKVDSISGEAHIWFIRGKKRHGFEFDVSLTWLDPATGIKGTIKLPSASPDDMDDLHLEADITDKDTAKAAQEAAALQAARSMKPCLQELLSGFYDELKQK